MGTFLSKYWILVLASVGLTIFKLAIWVSILSEIWDLLSAHGDDTAPMLYQLF
jgi:hypothetical protein